MIQSLTASKCPLCNSAPLLLCHQAGIDQAITEAGRHTVPLQCLWLPVTVLASDNNLLRGLIILNFLAVLCAAYSTTKLHVLKSEVADVGVYLHWILCNTVIGYDNHTSVIQHLLNIFGSIFHFWNNCTENIVNYLQHSVPRQHVFIEYTHWTYKMNMNLDSSYMQEENYPKH